MFSSKLCSSFFILAFWDITVHTCLGWLYSWTLDQPMVLSTIDNFSFVDLFADLLADEPYCQTRYKHKHQHKHNHWWSISLVQLNTAFVPYLKNICIKLFCKKKNKSHKLRKVCWLELKLKIKIKIKHDPITIGHQSGFLTIPSDVKDQKLESHKEKCLLNILQYI